ncbi:MAG: alpha/beta fold hydrolase [Gemmatimonadota bacterium]
MRTAIWILVGLIGAPLAAQQPGTDAGTLRLFQGQKEIGRENFRRTQDSLDQDIMIPIVSMRIVSHSMFSPAGRLLEYHSRGYDLGSDSLRFEVTVKAQGDSLRTMLSTGGKDISGMVAGPADAGMPNQAVITFFELVRRAAGRDTTFRLYIAGNPALIPITVKFQADTARLVLGPLQVRAIVNADGTVRNLEIPAQQVRVERWAGDSLPPLAGRIRPARDYAAPAGAPYTAEEVRIPIRAITGDTFSLAGTLTRPVMNRLVPVVVFISGSGSQPRDEELWPLVPDYRPFRQIADRLGRAGIASLRFDDRGTDASGGSPALATTADLADDVKQVIAWLRARRDLNPAQVGILGHSEGGMIGPMIAAADPQIAAVVIMAGPGKSGVDILRDQFRYPIENTPGLSPAERDSQLAGVEQSVQMWSRSSPWTRWFADYDPISTAHRIRQPVLILQGALDRQVSAGQADTLAAAIRDGGNRDVTVHIYPGFNHLFVPTAGTGSLSEYASLPDVHLPAPLLDDIAGWLAKKLNR